MIPLAPAPSSPSPPVVAPPAPAAASATVPEPVRYEPEADTGFHISLGLGLSGDGEAGFATQVKIGGRVSSKLRVYYHALNHWFARPDPMFGTFTTEWRIKAINGLGVDYFVLPNLALRISGGLAANTRRDLSSDPKAFGYSYTLGMTIPLTEGRATFSVDPFIHMMHYNAKSLAVNVAPTTVLRDNWVSSTIVGVTLNWCYR